MPAIMLITIAYFKGDILSNKAQGTMPPFPGRWLGSAVWPTWASCPPSSGLGKPSPLQIESAGTKWNLMKSSAPWDKAFLLSLCRKLESWGGSVLCLPLTRLAQHWKVQTCHLEAGLLCLCWQVRWAALSVFPPSGSTRSMCLPGWESIWAPGPRAQLLALGRKDLQGK